MRGDVVTVALQRDLGKPRPALVVQSDHFAGHPSTILLPITSTLIDAPLVRVRVDPDAANGLRKPSQIMLDKIAFARRGRIGSAVGRVDPRTMREVERRLLVLLGIAK